MDQKEIDKVLKRRGAQEKVEPSQIVKNRIDRTLEELPETERKRRLFPSAFSNRYWLSGMGCVVFFVVLLSYFQFSDLSSPLSPSNTSDNSVVYQQAPIEPEELLGVISRGQIQEEDINNIEIVTSIKQKDRWIVLASFGIGFHYHALVEVKKENNTNTKKLLEFTSIDQSRNTHWYSVEEGIGFGSVGRFVDRIEIQTDNMQLTSKTHNGYYMYVSDAKPEKVEFYSESDKLMRTMETFNFDEVYPLVAKNEGEYALFVVDEVDSIGREILEKQGIENDVTSIQTTSSLKNVNRQYEFLDLKKSPAYAVFNDKKMIYKTYNKDDLFMFLKQQSDTD
ncbi:hypothetical protein [Virgibacillus sp. DJP39]|uniref:hypothetical protein n=1 Tax=Virgibacillus sp. DJP39 TaxID=3409790 RepID=UPI003BB6ED62